MEKMEEIFEKCDSDGHALYMVFVWFIWHHHGKMTSISGNHRPPNVRMTTPDRPFFYTLLVIHSRHNHIGLAAFDNSP